jgi:hypothetical protein
LWFVAPHIKPAYNIWENRIKVFKFCDDITS